LASSLPLFIPEISAAVAAFIATNIDDLAVLLLLFARVRTEAKDRTQANRERRRIVLGQYLGFSVLVAASLPGVFARSIFSPSYLRWLGIIPLIIGIVSLLNRSTDDESPIPPASQAHHQGYRQDARPIWRDPYTYAIAGLTIANGGDNIAIYLSFFANQTTASLTISAIVFYLMVAIWCAIAYYLDRHSSVATAIDRYGSAIVPWVFICLGIYILMAIEIGGR
jgi:cadmium resistance protein CadD (predicted permease)